MTTCVKQEVCCRAMYPTSVVKFDGNPKNVFCYTMGAEFLSSVKEVPV